MYTYIYLVAVGKLNYLYKYYFLQFLQFTVLQYRFYLNVNGISYSFSLTSTQIVMHNMDKYLLKYLYIIIYIIIIIIYL